MTGFEEPDGEGAPKWIVTFADMISLLVTFFVLLITFSTMEKLELMPIPGVKMLGRGGTIPNTGTPTAARPPLHDLMSAVDARRGATVPHARPESELIENLEEMGQRLDAEHLELDLRDVSDGLLLRFGESASFAPGAAEVPPDLRQSLAEIARVLEHYKHVIVIEGFTDGAFKPTPEYPTAEDLGLARAAAAAEVMFASSALTPKLVQVAGLGQARNVASNTTAVERRLNRRIEIRILSLSKSRVQLLDRQEQER